MGLAAVKISGADRVDTNETWPDFLASKQFTTARSRLYKLSFSPLANVLGDVYAWIFDTAAGSNSSENQNLACVRLIPSGYADTWDLGEGGSLFENGIYVVVCSGAPPDGGTSPTSVGVAADNSIIVRADYRIE